jgi:DNA-binding Lrp family transcriptional regulator/hypoxanthine-guanine phosphoribosyltransferase
MPKENLLELKPIQKFVKGVGQKVKEYFGKGPACIIGLGDDGVFYAKGLYEWFKKMKMPVSLTFMDESGKGLEEEKVRGKKVLIVDNDIISGRSYREAMNTMKNLKEKLKIKDVKFAVLCDRMGLADFSVEGYPMPSSWDLRELDKMDLEIIKHLSSDGRKTFVEIAKEIGLTPVGVKKRVEKLVEKGILKIQGLLNIEKFYSISATIEMDVDPEAIPRLIKKFKNCPLVYNLVKVTSGHHNLILNLIAPSQKRIADFIEKQIRSDPKIRSLEVNIGDLPIVPKVHSLPNFVDKTKKCPCQVRCNECEYFL